MTTRKWIGKLLLLVAVVVLPLQSLAMAATFGKCHEQQSAAQLAGHGHDHDHGGDAHAHHHGAGDEGTTTSLNGHLCGHMVLYVASPLAVVAPPRFASWNAGTAERYTPYFPEHPHRPPRV